MVKFNMVVPAQVSPQKTVPAFIKKPSYHQSGIPTSGPTEPEIKLADQIEKIRASCKLAAGILKQVEQYIRVSSYLFLFKYQHLSILFLGWSYDRRDRLFCARIDNSK